MQVQSLGCEDPLEEGMATHSSILAWRIPCTEEPGKLQSIGLHRVGLDWSNLAWHSTASFVVGWSCSLWDVWQHLWLLPTRCQALSPSVVVMKKTSSHTTKGPQGGQNHLRFRTSALSHFCQHLALSSNFPPLIINYFKQLLICLTVCKDFL